MGKSTNQLIMEIHQRLENDEIKKALKEIQKYDKESEKILNHAEQVAAKLSKEISYNTKNALNRNFKSGNPFFDKLQASAGYEKDQSPNITLMARRLASGFGKDNKEITELNKQLSSTTETFIDFRDAINNAGEFVKKTFSNADFFKIYESKQQKPLFVGAEENARLEKDRQTAEKRIVEALKKEADIEEEIEKSRKKSLTAWQKERNERSKERNEIAAERNAINAKEAENKARKNEIAAERNAEKTAEQSFRERKYRDNKAFRDYKNAHPEEFGSIRRSRRYQFGQLITSATEPFADRGLIGRGVSTAAQIAQGALYGGMFGAAATGLAKLANGISELTKAADESYATIESLKTQLSVVFGGYTQSAQMYTQIADYATHSPFGIEQTTELATLLRQSGVEATKVMETLRILGDTATGDMDKMKRIANNYAQIVSIGKASMLDMRQFAYAGIPIFEAVSKELGVSQTKLRKMVSEGKVTAEIVEKVFKDMTGINGIFENATEKGAKTLKARKQNLQDIKSLALAGIGEEFANMGSRYGGDSLKMRHLEFSENFYEKIANQETFVNILKSVQNIEAGRDDILGIEQRITALEKKSLSGELEPKELKELEQLKADRDRIRQTLSDRDAVRANEASLYELYKGVDSNEIAKGLLWKEFLAGLVQSSYWILHQMTPTWLSKTLADRMNITAKGLGDTKDRYAAEYDFLKDLDIQKYFGSYAEQVVKKTQTANSDVVTGKRKESASYANAAQELLTKYEETEKYKKEEQQKQEERLRAIYTELVEIRKKRTDPSGALDFNNVSYKLFKELKDKGAISDGRELQTTYDNPAQARADLYTLFSQSKIRSGEALRIFGMNPAESANPELYNYVKDFSALFTDTNLGEVVRTGSYKWFFDNFNKKFTNIKEEANKIIDNKDLSEAKRESAQNVIDTISNAFAQWFPVTLEGIDIEEIFKGKNKKEPPVFQPLWKRILGNAFGFSPTAVTDTESAFDFYQENIMPRRRAASVITSALKSGEMNFDDIQRILANPANLNNSKNGTTASDIRDGGKVWQIDWQKVDKEIKKFALSLSNSSEVINAYKSSLEEERDALLNVLGSSISTFESDGTDARLISAKTLKDNKYVVSELEAGINAFGEKLETDKGEVVEAIKDGVLYGKDKDGNLVKLEGELLRLTGNIYEQLKKRYGEKDKEVKEAAVVSAQKGLLTGEMNHALEGRMIYNLGKGRNYNDFQFIERNSDNILNLFKARAEQMGYRDVKYKELIKSYAQGDSLSIGVVSSIMEKIWDEIASMSPEELEGYAKSQQENALNNLKKSLRVKFDEDFNTITLFDESKRNFVNTSDAGSGHIWNMNAWKSQFGYIRDSWKAVKEDYSGNDYLTRKLLKAKGYSEGTDLETLAEELSSKENKKITSEDLLKQFKADYIVNEIKRVQESFEDLLETTSQKSWTFAFETLGEDMLDFVKGSKDANGYLKDLKNSAIGLAGEFAKGTGELMQQAGFSIVTGMASKGNWAGVAAGLALAAAGGFAGGFGTALSNYKDEENEEDKQAKLQSITDQIKELLAQAKADANYYEKTLSHKKALSSTQEVTTRSVHDAVITPRGEVVTTDPRDYLIATKTPASFVGGAPTVNIKFVDKSTGVVITQQKQNYNESTNTLEIIALIENKVQEVIATSKGDAAFDARQARLSGNHVIA